MDIKRILNKTMIFSLPGGTENVAIQVHKSLLNMVNAVSRDTTTLDLHVDLFLEEDTIRDDVFPEMMEGVIAILKKRGLELSPETVKLRFKYVTIHKDKLTVDLLTYIPFRLVGIIRQIISLVALEANPNHNYWIREGIVLPKIDSDYSTVMKVNEDKAKNIYRAFRKGKISGVSYELPEDVRITVKPDYEKFDLTKNVITPHFIVTITCWGDIITDGVPRLIQNTIGQKFKSLGITIKF